MAENLHSAIQAMSLRDDDPIDLPDDPCFNVFEGNSLSLLGRLLNPLRQPMDKMIEDMPRVWRVYGRVPGITLSAEKFQFIFQRKEDMITVLNDRPWTYYQWTMLLDRWIPSPPLIFCHQWTFGYVSIIFRGSSLKNQSPTQRPVQSSQPQSPAKGKELSASPTVPPGFQPLFKELPIEERNAALLYISHSDETERLARIARVQQSINIGPEPSLPKITHDLTKGKGHVFSFEEPQRLNKRQNTFGVATSVQNEFQSKDKLMTRSFPLELEGASSSSLTSPTGFSIGTSFEAQSSGSKSGVKSSRKRPQRWKRLAMRAQRAKEEGTVVAVTEEEKQQESGRQRRCGRCSKKRVVYGNDRERGPDHGTHTKLQARTSKVEEVFLQ
ncbi:hypothetical protein Rs2_02766 [Raphanus sativus]|nr:hypothetical protein Rs2_02766 [Raphanus sativus]